MSGRYQVSPVDEGRISCGSAEEAAICGVCLFPECIFSVQNGHPEVDNGAGFGLSIELIISEMRNLFWEAVCTMFIHLFSKHTPNQHISFLMNISEGDQLRKRAKQNTIEHVTNVIQNGVQYLHVELAVQKSERQQREQTEGWSSANVCQY